MEDSYTVHRRRKAAAAAATRLQRQQRQRREKTPEAARLRQGDAPTWTEDDDDDDEEEEKETQSEEARLSRQRGLLGRSAGKERSRSKSTTELAAAAAAAVATAAVATAAEMDEAEERRARMERMCEDTERMEQQQQQQQLSVGNDKDGGRQMGSRGSMRINNRQRLAEPGADGARSRSRSPAATFNRSLSAHEEPRKSTSSAPASARTSRDEQRFSNDGNGSEDRRRQQQPVARPPVPPVKAIRKSREHVNDAAEVRKKLGSPPAEPRRSSSSASDRRFSSGITDEDRELEQQKQQHIPRKHSNSRHHNPAEGNIDYDPRQQELRSSRSPPTQSHLPLMKKQIIPLTDSRQLYEDMARAKRAYHRRDYYEYEYDNDDEEEEEEEEEYEGDEGYDYGYTPALRRRKTSVIHSEREHEEIGKSVELPQSKSRWWWPPWMPFSGAGKVQEDDREEAERLIMEEVKKELQVQQQQQAKEKLKEKVKEQAKEKVKEKVKAKAKEEVDEDENKPPTRRQLLSAFFHLGSEFNAFCRQNPREVRQLRHLRNLCAAETFITLIVCGLGALAFRYTEGAYESYYKCGVKRVKRDFLDSLWGYSQSMHEDDWKSMARKKLMEFEEQLHEAHEAGVQSYSGQKSWGFLNSMVYSLTVITTIGYGHISPTTATGRALTIVYAIFGIPLFLIVLADFGKLFTRGIKFLWAFVRRLYYTGSCRKVRSTVQVQEMMKGVQLVYDLAKFRRPSQMTPEELEEMKQQQQTVLSLDPNQQQQQQHSESPSTPAMSTFEIDDEFNLPISVAITILVIYIFVGATVFNLCEDWSFFESFYFVFISMSTIGFGDFVPTKPLYTMLSMVYLIFGLALTSMCINVVQVMLTDQFKQASQKIGATIGLHVSEEDGSLRPPEPPEPVEVAEVHATSPTAAKKADEARRQQKKAAPKARQEDDGGL